MTKPGWARCAAATLVEDRGDLVDGLVLVAADVELDERGVPVLGDLVCVAGCERRADVLDVRDLRDAGDDVRDRSVEGGRAHASRAALDEDVLGGLRLEAGIEDPVHATRLARPGRALVDARRPDHAAERDGDDDEGEPAEGGGLPVSWRSSDPCGPRGCGRGGGALAVGAMVPVLLRVRACRVELHVSTLGAQTARRRRREAGFGLRPADDSASYPGRRRPVRSLQYVHCVSRLGHLARTYWFDAVVVLLARAAMVEVAVRRGLARTRRPRRCGSSFPRSPSWRCRSSRVAASRSAARRRTGCSPRRSRSSTDGSSRSDQRLRPRDGGRVPAREPARRAQGADRAWPSSSAARRSSSTTRPSHSASEQIFIPLLFGICWLGGLRAPRAGGGGRGGGGTGGPGRAGARDGRAHRRRRGARADRAASSTTSSPTPSA